MLTHNSSENTHGCEGFTFKMNRDNRYHDSLVVKLCRKLKREYEIDEIYLDFEVKERFKFLSHLPDAVISLEGDNPVSIALELELTQKNRERIREIFKAYSESPFINNVIFVFSKDSVFRSYQKFFSLLEHEINTDKFLFLMIKGLNNKELDFKYLKAVHQNKEVSLSKLFRRCMSN